MRSFPLQYLLDNAATAAALLDDEGTIVDVNTAFGALLHRGMEVLVGTPLLRWVRERDHSFVSHGLEVVRSGGARGFRVEAILEHGEDTDAPGAAGRSTPVHLDLSTTGELVPGEARILLIAHDVSERMRLEAAVRESEARVRAVLEAVREGIVIQDADGAIRQWNMAAESLLGPRVEAVAPRLETGTARPAGWQVLTEQGAPMPPEAHPLALTLRTGAATADARHGVRRPDGQVHWLRVSTARVRREEDHGVGGAVAAFSDAGDGAAPASTPASTPASRSGAAERRLQALGRLAAGLAQETGGVLLAVARSAGRLRDGTLDGDSVREEAGAIVRDCERARTQAQAFLAFAERLPSAPAPQLVDAVVEALQPVLRHALRGARLVFVPGAGDAEVVIDRVELELALVDIVSAARERVPVGGLLRLATAAERLDEAAARPLRLSAGRYVTVEARAEDAQGTAAGAPMTRRFEAHDTSPLLAEGAGATGEVPALGAASGAGSGATASASRGMVLVVDDDAAIRGVVVRALGNAGYRAEAVGSAVEAIALLEARSGEVALLLTDLVMPEASGRVLIEEAHRRWPTVALLAMTGVAGNDVLRATLRRIGVSVVEKPFALDQLVSAVGAVLASQRAPAR